MVRMYVGMYKCARNGKYIKHTREISQQFELLHTKFHTTKSPYLNKMFIHYILLLLCSKQFAAFVDCCKGFLVNICYQVCSR